MMGKYQQFQSTGMEENMILRELEALLSKARADGAGDDTTVYLTNKKLKYMRDISAVTFEKREGWPAKEWPVVISSKI